MNYTPIGRVRPIHRGAHDPSTAYAALDVVRREDGFASYMARRDVPAGTPLADGEYWGLLSDGGLKAVADASCPAFEKCGGAAVCHPVAGYPLEVATLIAPKQAGDGEPSPDNIRRISGWTGAKLNHTNDSGLEHTYTADFGQTVYGGTLDWDTGMLTVDRAFYTFDGSEGLISGGWSNPYSYVLWGFLPDVVNYGMSDTADAYCSHYIVRSVANVITNAIAGFAIYDRGHLIFSSPTHADVDAFKSYLAAQHAAGTPVQVCYKLATPTTIQLTPVQIAALAGTNTLYTDCGDTRAAGRSDMTWVTQGILDRLAALEAAAVSE